MAGATRVEQAVKELPLELQCQQEQVDCQQGFCLQKEWVDGPELGDPPSKGAGGLSIEISSAKEQVGLN